MSIYAIGDVQGHFEGLQRLLEKIKFEPGDDFLWFVGDLVNRGPDSLAVLRLVKGLGKSAITVLGNHDLHLLAFASGAEAPKQRDTLQQVIGAPDRDELLDWLRFRPLAYYDDGFLLVHAGILPEWDAAFTLSLAAEVESALRAADYPRFLAELYGNEPSAWQPALFGTDRLRVIVNALTRMRFLRNDGSMDFSFNGPPDEAPRDLTPWFELPRASGSTAIVFGHWSALGVLLRPDLIALDSGCVWGRQLSAVRLEDRALFQVACDRPG